MRRVLIDWKESLGSVGCGEERSLQDSQLFKHTENRSKGIAGVVAACEAPGFQMG